MSSRENEALMLKLSGAIGEVVDEGAVAVVIDHSGHVSIMQFEAHEHDECVAAFENYFSLFSCDGWRNCFASAFHDPKPKRHIATILITETSVENGVVFPLSEVN